MIHSSDQCMGYTTCLSPKQDDKDDVSEFGEGEDELEAARKHDSSRSLHNGSVHNGSMHNGSVHSGASTPRSHSFKGPWPDLASLMA